MSQPTASSLHGLTPAQIRKAISGASKPATEHQPTQVIPKKQKPLQSFREIQKQDLGMLLDLPYSTNQLARLVPTPDWFTFRQNAEVSVIVPLYMNSIERLAETWDFDTEGMRVELIFVDDGCPRDSKLNVLAAWEARKDEIKKPIGRIYGSSVSQGWGSCCNIGAYMATGAILIFLHPEAKLFPGWISPLVRQARKPEVGAAAAMMIDEPSETLLEAGMEWNWSERRFLSIGRESYSGKRISKPFLLSNCPSDLFRPSERERISSLGMAIRRSEFLDLGGFSPNIYGREWGDADLSLGLKERGLQLIHQPYSRIYFDKPNETDKFPDRGAAFFYNKWELTGRMDRMMASRRLEPRREIKNILIRRDSAHGDVLLAAAVAPALKKKFPGSKILFATECPEVIEGNPWIDKTISEPSERLFDVFVNLDMVYEYRPNSNILDAFASAAGVEATDCQCFLQTAPIAEQLPDRYVVIHAGKTLWAGRNWSSIKFDQLSNRIKEAGHFIVCVGTLSDQKTFSCDVDLRGKTTIHQLAHVIQNAQAFVGIDSFPMHVAQCFDVPGAAFFGSIKPETRIYRQSMRPVLAAGLRCLGCHHRKPTPCTSTPTCEVGVQECASGVSVELMWRNVSEAISKAS